MCVGVALSVAVFGAVGAGDVHGIGKVTDNIGVGVFIYGDARLSFDSIFKVLLI